MNDVIKQAAHALFKKAINGELRESEFLSELGQLISQHQSGQEERA